MKLLQQLQQPGWRGNLVNFLLGLCICLGFAPFNIWPLPILCFLGFITINQLLTAKQMFGRAYIFAFGWFLAGTGWVYVSIHDFGNASFPVAAFLTVALALESAFHVALVFALAQRYLLKHKGLYCFLVMPVALVVSEILRTVVLTGFPWLFLGYTHTDTLLAGYAPWIGVYGISWLTALMVGCLLFVVLTRSFRLLPLAVLLGIWVLPIGLKQFAMISETGQQKSISLIQANIAQDRKWLPEERLPTIQLYERMTESELGRDLIIWPEASLPVSQHRITGFLDRMSDKAKKMDSAIILGIPAYEPKDKVSYNRVISLGEDRWHYNKRHLVPFGEYVPLEDWLRGMIEFFDLPMSQFVEGASDQRAMKIGDIWLAPTICYEIVYPEVVRENVVNQGETADILLTISNDAWFGESIGPIQHFQMARMRAQELGRPLVRGTNTGITGIVDHLGQVTHKLEPYKRGTLQGEVNLVQGETIYMKGGYLFVFVWCALVIVFLAWHYYKSLSLPIKHSADVLK